VFNATFNNSSVFDISVIGGGNQNPEKTNDLPHINNKLYHII
jgi:hypothetical protein